MFDYDDTTIPEAKITLAMRARIETVAAELQEYVPWFVERGILFAHRGNV